jgi:6-phosphogluconolactonase
VQHRLDVQPDGAAVARSAAAFVAARARAATASGGNFTFAVSGGRTPWMMFAELASLDVPWERVVVYQVDERCAPFDDPDRNLAHLRDALGDAPADVRPMPVEDADLDAASASYAAELPDFFDLVHLGLGPDGHTASLVPGDPVLDVADRLVAPTGGEYQGRRRMTLTYPALARARQLLWLVDGDAKRVPLARLLAGDRGIPAGRVTADASTIVADLAAAPAAEPTGAA